jgi:acyl dehydratase
MQIVTVTKTATMEKMSQYSGAGNFHSDDKAGEQSGLGGAIVQGGQLVGYLNEMMVRTLGVGYIAGGAISVNFIKAVRPGDTVTTHAIRKETPADGDPARIEFDIWLENQHGEKCTVGTASGHLTEA